jgi:hypothetical protein
MQFHFPPFCRRETNEAALALLICGPAALPWRSA